MSRRGRRPAPLPVRDGLNPTRVALPRDESWDSLVEFLEARFPADAARVREQVSAGEVVDELGRPYSLASPYPAGGLAFLFRDPPVEARVPFEVEVLSGTGGDLVASIFPEIHPDQARIGDLGLIETDGEIGAALCVFDVSSVIVVTEDGQGRAPRETAIRAFKVG